DHGFGKAEGLHQRRPSLCHSGHTARSWRKLRGDAMKKLMGWTKKRGREQGFTFIELMVSVAILTVVVGVVVQGLTRLMQRNTVETTKVDLTQESREFMDQIVSDIHQAGYPSLKTF